jgi:type III pantothenate kinase
MLLAIDAGNTNIVFAIFDGDRKLRSWRMATDHNRTGDDYAVWLTQLMSLIGLRPADITDAILASVVPPATFSLTRLCKDHFGISPMMVGSPEVSLGIQAKVDFPNEVGVDRLVNALGAQAVHETPLIVVDIGTATTFDVVDEAGDFVGGIIAPGPNSALEALHRIAAKLPRIEIERPERVIGKGTVGAMRSGIYWGYVGLIEGLLTRIQEEFGRPMTIVATGGLSGLFTKATNMKHDNDPEITERGLRVIYERNKVT